MKELPHIYQVSAKSQLTSHLNLNIDNLPSLEIAAPIGFNGPGDVWSPEDLFISSIASCTVLSFKAIARASKLDWISIECFSEGVLDRLEGKTQFTKVNTKVKLVIPKEASKDKAEKLIIKAEASCLISNSITAKSHIESDIYFET